MLLLLALWLVPGPQSADAFREFAECGQCHQKIGDEWARSRHAAAGAQEAQQLLSGLGPKRAARLRRYYRPQPVLITGLDRAPLEREAFESRGVDCLACHMDAQYRMHGPLDVAAPHRVVADPAYSTVETCVPCHGQGDEMDQVTSWREGGFETGQVYCQVCHMPDVRRKLVQHWAMPELPERPGGSHVFRGPSDAQLIASALVVQLEATEGQLKVRVSAAVIGHAFPGIAFRQAIVQTRGLSAAGGLLWEQSEPIDGIEHNNRLEPGESRTFLYPLRRAARVVTRVLYRLTPRVPEDQARVLLEKTLGNL